jgi:Tetratrico peptide repeat
MNEIRDWENQLKLIWEQLGKIPDIDFVEKIKIHTSRLPEAESNAIAYFENACAFDSTGYEKEAEPLNRSALSLGLTGIRRRKARIQLASTLRNNGKFGESIEILIEEKNNYSDELNDAIDAFLALSLSSGGKDKEALSIVLKTKSSHLPRYNKSLYNYATKLTE